MAFITLRTANVVPSPGGTVKGSPLTNSELDNNFANLNLVIGFRENLTTTANDNLVAAVNEVKNEISNIDSFQISNGTSSVSILTADGPVEVSANFIPSVSNTIDLGSATRRFKDLFLTGSTINLGGQTISSSDGFIKVNNNNVFSTDGKPASSNVRLLSSSGANFVELSGNTTIDSNVIFELPSTAGTSGQGLVTNSTGRLTFQTLAEFGSNTVMVFNQNTAPTGWTKDLTNFNNHTLRVVTGAASSGGSVDFTAAFSSQALTANISVNASMGNVTQGGTVLLGAATQGGNISISVTGNVTQGGSISGDTGQAAAPSTNTGATTLSTPEIPSHSHDAGSRTSPTDSFNPGTSQPAGPGVTSSGTGGGGSHSHSVSGGQHAHPVTASFTGQSHAHPVTASFTGQSHAHPAASFTGQSHAHPISAPATFTGDAINLGVKYVDVIWATKD